MEKKLPLLLQYVCDLQRKYPDCILAVEVGSFFEVYEVNGLGFAKEASKILDIVLTRKDKSILDSPMMCGFPRFSCDIHFKRLVQAGKSVVVVSQTIHGTREDKNKKVSRHVSQILSPGTVVESLSRESANYFASVYLDDGVTGIALIDVSTGNVSITELPRDEANEFLSLKNPSEILITSKENDNYEIRVRPTQLSHKNSNPISKLSQVGTILSEVYEIKNPTSNPTFSIGVLGLELCKTGSIALANLLHFLIGYNALLLKKLGLPTIHVRDEHLYLPSNSYNSLNITANESVNKELDRNTLIGILDRCKTAMGQRKLREWIQSPLCDIKKIKERHNKVGEFISSNKFLDSLKQVYDFSRLSRRMALARLLPHEIEQFHISLSIVESVLKDVGAEEHKEATKIRKMLDRVIDISVAATTAEFTISFFKNEAQQSLFESHDQWKRTENRLQSYKSSLEKRMGVSNKLRIIEKTDGFHLTGPKSIGEAAKLAKMTVTVKASEVQLTDHEWNETSKMCAGYKHLFLAKAQTAWEEFQHNFVNKFGEVIVRISDKVAEIDVLSTFAKISIERNYSRPELVDSDVTMLDFKSMRHPVVELSTMITEGFISNNVNLGLDHKKILVIYGANSAGKSTILKSVALNIVMSQIGCYVAASAGTKLSVFDSILTRISSFDSLAEGLSTFTLEMSELQSALLHRTKKSIFLLDEIGRGTSVECGEAIAYGTLSYLDDKKSTSITLFATHYHSLAPEIEKLKTVQIKNVSCYCDESGGLIFLRKLEDGAGKGSYGIEVAKSCGIPEEIIRVAERYNKKNFNLFQSRYSAKMHGTSCEHCHKHRAQQTHHIVEQKQGSIKVFLTADGQNKDINDETNLALLCASCHEEVTRGRLIIIGKQLTSAGKYKLIYSEP